MVGLFSALTNRAVLPSLVICGRVVMSGTMMPITTDLDELFVAIANSGAKNVLLPTECKEKCSKIKPELLDGITILYYSTPLIAAKKALGVD